MSSKLTKVDDYLRARHFYLTNDDECYFIGEYTPGEPAQYSKTNQLIYNLKKCVLTKASSDYYHKITSMKEAGNLVSNIKGIENVTIIPIPPSKAKNDPKYDDRMVQILKKAQARNKSIDYREIIVQTVSTAASHLRPEGRISPDELLGLYSIDESQCDNLRPNLIIFDDMLTTGSHYVTAKKLLKERYPNHRIIGLFLACRIPRNDFSYIIDEFPSYD